MSVEQPKAGYGYVAISGTSMATPHVAGLVALLKQRTPTLTTPQVKSVLASQGNSWNPDTGFGVPNWNMF
jgi:subtilisin family serine protease